MQTTREVPGLLVGGPYAGRRLTRVGLGTTAIGWNSEHEPHGQHHYPLVHEDDGLAIFEHDPTRCPGCKVVT